MRILIAITGASGSLYAQRLIQNIDSQLHEVHVVFSKYAEAVIGQEIPGGLVIPDTVQRHNRSSMNACFASGSNALDAMVVIPCSMGTLARVAHGISDDLLLRAADVMIKERRKLILVPRETPISLIHLKNMELLLHAGAVILPANPHYYHQPKSVVEVIDTVVARVLDHLGLPQTIVTRWQEEKE